MLVFDLILSVLFRPFHSTGVVLIRLEPVSFGSHLGSCALTVIELSEEASFVYAFGVSATAASASEFLCPCLFVVFFSVWAAFLAT